MNYGWGAFCWKIQDLTQAHLATWNHRPMKDHNLFEFTKKTREKRWSNWNQNDIFDIFKFIKICFLPTFQIPYFTLRKINKLRIQQQEKQMESVICFALLKSITISVTLQHYHKRHICAAEARRIHCISFWINKEERQKNSNCIFYCDSIGGPFFSPAVSFFTFLHFVSLKNTTHSFLLSLALNAYPDHTK